MTKFISIIVSIGIAGGVLVIGIALTTIAYTPTEKEINHVIEGTELLIHKAKMKKHGIRNTSVVYVHHDNSEWYYN